MQDVLVDTSTLLDLVLYYQRRHRRNRSVASSAAAAIEALIIYEHPVVESPSATAVLQAEDNRFLRFYCDEAATVASEQFRTLLEYCDTLKLSDQQVSDAYNHALRTMSGILAPIDDPNDLRAYELYDYLPYHLGEDPSAIECRVIDPSVADLERIELSGILDPGYISRVVECLQSCCHPTRAAWALPMLRLFYYQALQSQSNVHFLPHATKSTIAFGRESQTVAYRRLLEYCTEVFRSSFLALAQKQLGGLMILLPVPAFAEVLLGQVHDWENMIAQLTMLRNDSTAKDYRDSVTDFFGHLEQASSLEEQRTEIESSYGRVQQQSQAWASKLRIGNTFRNIRIALPFFRSTDQCHNSLPNNLMLLHDLYSATGVTGMSKHV